METMKEAGAQAITPRDPDRRRFLARSAVGVVAGAATLAACGGDKLGPPDTLDDYGGQPTPSPSGTIQPVTDTDVLVLLIQLEYLNAEYFARAALGAPLPAALVSGTGTLGSVTGALPVTFSDVALGDQMRELAAQKIDRIVRLRAVLGASVPARPDVNLAFAGGPFAKYADDALARPTTPPTTPVLTDVYASQDQFLLGAFILQDAIVNAWRAAIPLIVGAANIDLAAGMLASVAAHAGLVRSQLYVRGAATGSRLRQNSILLSDQRDSYVPIEDDQGVASGNTFADANINPADGNGLVFSRALILTLNTFFMTGNTATSGGFFTAGVNGAIRQSAQAVTPT